MKIFIATFFKPFPGIFLLILVGCSKNSSSDSDACAGISVPEISSESEITAGETLQLYSSDVPGAQYYLWSGPNGFISQEQNPAIENAQPAQSGVYAVQVGVAGGCILTAESDSISISLPPASCNPSNNTANINGVSNISVYSATGAASGGSYFFTANGIGGDIEFEFPGTDRPQDGVYSIRGVADQFLAGDVRLRLISQSSNWPASSGNVHLEINNDNKLVAIFCSVPVTGQTVTLNTTATGKVTEY